MVGNSWHRAALQVNPFAYIEHHKAQVLNSGESWSSDEGSYNNAMVAAAKSAEVSIVALTDHFSFHTSENLRIAFEEAGIAVLPGFEAVSGDGVHMLCLFERHTPATTMEEYITELVGAATDERRHALSELGFLALAAKVSSWGGIAIAAHALGPKGLLAHLSGLPLERAFSSPDLLAIATDGLEPNEAQNQLILNNRGDRKEPIATINAADISEPTFFEKSTTSSWMKIGSECLGDSDGLLGSVRQCFLDHTLRTSTQSDRPTVPATWIRCIKWQGSPIFGSRTIDFNPGVNVLIGGRGTGKSAVLSSIGWVLDLDAELSPGASQRSISESELVGGGEVELTIDSPGGPIKIRRRGGQATESEIDIVPTVSGYGQGELERRSNEQAFRISLIERFCDGLTEARGDVAEHKSRINLLIEKIGSEQEQLGATDGSRERLDFVTTQLASASASGLNPATEMVNKFRGAAPKFTPIPENLSDAKSELLALSSSLSERLQGNLPAEDLDDPRPDDAVAIATALQHADEAVTEAFNTAATAIEDSVKLAQEIVKKRAAAQAEAEDERSKILGELGDEEIRIPNLEEQKGRLTVEVQQRSAIESRIQNLEQDLEQAVSGLRQAEDRVTATIARGCGQANTSVGKSVVVKPAAAQNATDLRSFLVSEGVSETSTEHVVNRILSPDGPDSPAELVALINNNEQWFTGDERSIRNFKQNYETDPLFLRRLAATSLTSSIEIELAVGSTSKPIEKVSDGQRVTAILMILLAESTDPILIDQPEDDLDNRFIATDLVTSLRNSSRRQVIVSTHNANIAVLGGCDALTEMNFDDPNCGVAARGSIDSSAVSAAVQETLEGGSEALAKRQRRYGTP